MHLKIPSLKEMRSRKRRKIGYLSALTIIVGSTIGAGIFFRNGVIASNNNGNLPLIIISWLIGSFGVLLLSLALIEVASSSKNNKGFLSWIANFNSQLFSRYATIYVTFISLPLQSVVLPLFFAQSIQDAAGVTLNGWIIAAMAFGIFLWLSFMTFFSLRAGELFSWFFVSLKYIPLIAAPIIALVTVNQGSLGTEQPLSAIDDPIGLTSLSRGLGLFASIPAILFTYGGFYSAASLRSNLKKPKSLGILMVGGVVIIGATYLFVTVGFALGTTNGRVSGIAGISKAGRIAINTLVALSIFGVINNSVLAVPPIYATTIKEKKVYFCFWLCQKINPKNAKISGFIIFVGIVSLYYALLVPIGLYALNASPASQARYGALSANLYQIADLITGFSGLMFFTLISFSVVGAIRNRKTKRIEVTQSKYFLWFAYPAVAFVWIAALYFLISGIANIVLLEGIGRRNAIIRFSFFIFTLTVPLVTIFASQRSKNYKAFVKLAPTLVVEN